YLTLWFPLLIWWTPLCLIRQILTRRFRLYAYNQSGKTRLTEFNQGRLAPFSSLSEISQILKISTKLI
ncbi:hypothetical protein, partial [Escherichia coli]|uniref:hypothetical protein n=1 Tax=Escherichia coli TaxID=562 RepID=UPI001BAECC50